MSVSELQALTFLRVWRAIPSRGIVIAEFSSFEAAKTSFESSFLLEGHDRQLSVYRF